MTTDTGIVDRKGMWERVQEAYGGKTAAEIARILGKHKQSVYRWRDGETPGLDTLAEIARSRNVLLDWLVTGSPPKRLASMEDADPVGETKVRAVRDFGANELAELYEGLAQELRERAGSSLSAEAREIGNIYQSLPQKDREDLMATLRDAAEMVCRDRAKKDGSREAKKRPSKAA